MSEQDPDGGPAFEVPHDLRAEQLLLGTTMRSKDAVADVVEILHPASFYRVGHEFIYNAVLELYAAGESTDPIEVATKLTEQGLLARAGGRDYLHKLVNMVRSTAEAETLALLVEDKALRRRLIETATRIDRLAHADAPTADLVDTIQAEVHAVTAGHSPSWAEARPMADVMEGVLDEVEGIGSYIGAPAGVPTGLPDLDALTNGLHPGQLIVLGSRPAHGKSTLALTILRACSFRNGLPAVIYSLEMGRNEIGMRLLSAESRVPLHHMRSGNMTDRDWTRAATRMPEVSFAPLFIDDAPNLTLAEIRSKSRRLKAQHGIKLVVVDYIQLLDHGRHKYGSRYEDVNEVSRRLKLLAKELHLPVIALSQLNRAPEQRADKRPQIYDLRDSGTLEDDADLVVLLHRDDAYAADNRPGEADLIVAKHRNGPTAIITVAFHPTISAFTDPGDRGSSPTRPTTTSGPRTRPVPAPPRSRARYRQPCGPPPTAAATTKEAQVTTQPDHQDAAAPRPATLHELRTALSRYGLPGDREQFEQALAAALDASPIGDLAAVAEVIATYRHRLVLRTDEQAMASLAAPIGGQHWTPAADTFARLRSAGGDR